MGWFRAVSGSSQCLLQLASCGSNPKENSSKGTSLLGSTRTFEPRCVLPSEGSAHLAIGNFTWSPTVTETRRRCTLPLVFLLGGVATYLFALAAFSRRCRG